MTYCLGVKTQSGIIGLADTRITTGNDTITAKKVFTLKRDKHTFFIMTSGLRSVRDKAITYFNEVIEAQDKSFKKLYVAVNEFGKQVKRVAKEDRESLEQSGMSFNLYAIVGGKLEDDIEPKLYLLYPQGNWIEVGRYTPFVIIGNSGFGTPILKRSISYESDLRFALKSAFLSFDATRISANDVDYPIDVVVMPNDSSYHIGEHRFEERELGHISEFWNTRLREAIEQLPTDNLDEVIKMLDETNGVNSS